MRLKWSDSDEIGYQLSEKFPQIDPLTVRFTDLQKWVTELEGFAGKADEANEGALEAIQMAWLEYFRDKR